tara:strand:- start:177 stop:521 length:345 start_codon:yes stop_codon:yes gene_type:complete
MTLSLKLFFALMLIAMLAITTAASLDRGLVAAAGALWPDLWFRATLADAYFAFLTVWIWIAWREPTWPRRLAWLVAVLCLGSIAIALYALALLGRADPEDPVRILLTRRRMRTR